MEGKQYLKKKILEITRRMSDKREADIWGRVKIFTGFRILQQNMCQRILKWNIRDCRILQWNIHTGSKDTPAEYVMLQDTPAEYVSKDPPVEYVSKDTPVEYVGLQDTPVKHIYRVKGYPSGICNVGGYSSGICVKGSSSGMCGIAGYSSGIRMYQVIRYSIAKYMWLQNILAENTGLQDTPVEYV